MRPSLFTRKVVLATLLAMAAGLAGCEADDFVAWATVVGVDELEAQDAVDERSAPYEEQLQADPAWRVELRLDDGSTVRVTRNGERRYEPGDRVRVLRTADGRLLL